MTDSVDLTHLDALFARASKRSMDGDAGWLAYGEWAHAMERAYPALRERIRELEATIRRLVIAAEPLHLGCPDSCGVCAAQREAGPWTTEDALRERIRELEAEVAKLHGWIDGLFVP